MAVKTGFKTAELEALADRIKAQGAALVADLPREPLWSIHLACCCDRCIDPQAYPKLIKTPPPDLTEPLIRQYFGGVAAVESVQTDEARYEARVILTHVLSLLGQMIVLPPEEGREMRRRMSYIDADYLLPYLLQTGLLDSLSANTTMQIRTYLLDVTHYAIACATPRLDDVLIYLSIFTDALPEVVATYRKGPPRRHLRFWSAIGRINSRVDRNSPQTGTDVYSRYRDMKAEDQQHLLGALARPEVEKLILRYAMGARDEQWVQYLSNLLDWREATLLRTRFSEHKDASLR